MVSRSHILHENFSYNNEADLKTNFTRNVHSSVIQKVLLMFWLVEQEL